MGEHMSEDATATTAPATHASPPLATEIGEGSTGIQPMRPFFGYYGGKWRDAPKHYPAPRFSTIVEPFAGSAGYSLRYPEWTVILCEIDPAVAEIWRYLTRVSASEILNLPDMPDDTNVDDLPIVQEAKWLIGMWLNRGVATPRKRPSRWMREGIRPGCFWGKAVRQRLAAQVERIRHWQIYNRSYLECPAPAAATWFIDPPYQHAGRHYRFGADLIDYERLGAWCTSRLGQVIVCENAGATWLPFRELASVRTTRSRRLSKEVYWSNEFAATTPKQ